MASSSVLLPACANWVPGASACGRQGLNACTNCKLVVYCGAACQTAHWPEHKNDCRSPMGKENWRPAWDRENRTPPWENDATIRKSQNMPGCIKYLWGDSPALDVLKLENNEGLGYGEDIALLFASSGDLRHVVKTVAGLPEGMTQQINVTINDREFDIVARNAILLLLALTGDSTDSTDAEETTIAEAMIHFWYSASLSSSVHSRLHNRVKPLFEDVCSRITHRPLDVLIGKTWEFPAQPSLRLVLKKKDWFRILEVFDPPCALYETPSDMTLEEATRIRTAVTLAPERADYRDRWFFNDMSPFKRIAKLRFREDGLLLPFGHPRSGFDIPNQSFFYDSKIWLLDDQADPSQGWPVLEVQQTPSPALRDWYGKLFIYLHEMFQRFLDRLRTTRISFDLYNVYVVDLPQHLESDKYSRIDVANICDARYLGIGNTLSRLAPLLQPPRQNPHATFVTLFINAVKETFDREHDTEEEKPNLKYITNYLPFPQQTPRMVNNGMMHDPAILRIWDAWDLALDVDKYFDRYMQLYHFKQVEADLCLEMKIGNTVAGKWPARLKLQPGQEGAEEEFRLNLGSGSGCTVRYVEWRRRE